MFVKAEASFDLKIILMTILYSCFIPLNFGRADVCTLFTSNFRMHVNQAVGLGQAGAVFMDFKLGLASF